MSSLLRNGQCTQSGYVNMEQRWETEEAFHIVELPLPLASFPSSFLPSLLSPCFLPSYFQSPFFLYSCLPSFPAAFLSPLPVFFFLIPPMFSSSSLISSSLPVSRLLSWEVVNHSYPPHTLPGTNQRILHTAPLKFSQRNQWVYWSYVGSMKGEILQEHGWPQRSCPRKSTQWRKWLPWLHRWSPSR